MIIFIKSRNPENTLLCKGVDIKECGKGGFFHKEIIEFLFFEESTEFSLFVKSTTFFSLDLEWLRRVKTANPTKPHTKSKNPSSMQIIQ